MERLVKFLLWARGGWKIYVGGPDLIGEHVRRIYSATGARAFDVKLMSRVYDRPFEVVITRAGSVPAQREISSALGGHLDGCRVGFDLGASDYKISAVLEGESVYSHEFPWAPKDQPDPQFPAEAERIKLHVPDEKSRRVGQAVAAASLPDLRSVSLL